MAVTLPAGFLASATESCLAFLLSAGGTGFTSPSVMATASFLAASSEGVFFVSAMAATLLVLL